MVCKLRKGPFITLTLLYSTYDICIRVIHIMICMYKYELFFLFFFTDFQNKSGLTTVIKYNPTSQY